MTKTINITYDPVHLDYLSEKFFPQTSLLTFNQVIDTLLHPEVKLAVEVLSGEFYIINKSCEPIHTLTLTDEAIEGLEVLEQENITEYSSIEGRYIGGMCMAWDIYHKDFSENILSKENAFATELEMYKGNLNPKNTALFLKH